ncbi:ABC-type transport auxiliary lipoprotein family protein [Aliidiomarina indica]|uniref:ABC-type transport auxiliary lipoprotein family protein n=1 Tax=Aliidiomarina indica TaxID=2749147 RepID=UPI00188E6BF3|nr:ABC-type transport auxiliary lipoprotein family protein [Aliidiomarina indica]
MKIMGSVRLIALLMLSTSALMACTLMPEAEEVASYRLTPATITQTSTDVSARSIQVKRPLAVDLFAGDRLLRLQDDGSFNAIAGARWNNPIPILWRDWVIDALWRDPRFQAISSDSEQLRSDYQLIGTLRSFHVQGQEAEIRFDAQLIQSTERRVVAEHSFVVRQAVRGRGASAVASSLSEAANRLNQDLREWLLTHAQPL